MHLSDQKCSFNLFVIKIDFSDENKRLGKKRAFKKSIDLKTQNNELCKIVDKLECQVCDLRSMQRYIFTCVNIGESFQKGITIDLQKSALIQPRTSPGNFGGRYWDTACLPEDTGILPPTPPT